jgi:diaminopimelate epimerase
MKLAFTKMQGLGNDFVVIDNRETKLRRLSSLAKKLCDRRLGVGADQLLLLSHSQKSDFKMRIFNADGSEVEMCGNGLRCLGKYIWDNILRCGESTYAGKYCQTIDSLSIETLAGNRNIQKTGNLFRVNMGEPVITPDKIPVASKMIQKKYRNETLCKYPLKVKNRIFRLTCVSMGNPHAVTVVKKVDKTPVDQYGPLIENNGLFPDRTNVEFIEMINRSNIKMRVWERGTGETMACGTGASAAMVASVLMGATDRKVTVHLPGGKLLLEWSAKDNNVYMTGSAKTVFDGSIEI